MTGINEQSAALRVSDADRNGTLRRLHNAVALGLIDIDEFEERSALVSQARLHSDLDTLVGDLPGPGAIVTSATDRVELRGVMGSLKRQGEWTVPTRLALHRRMGSVDLDLTRARFAGPMVIIELDMKFGGLDLRLPDGASASIDDVEVVVGSAHDHRRDAPAEGTPHVILTGKVVCGSVDIRGPAQVVVRPRPPLTLEQLRTDADQPLPPSRAADQLADQRGGVEVGNPFGDQPAGEGEPVDGVPRDRLAAVGSAQRELDEHLLGAVPDAVHIGVQVGHQREQPLERLAAGLFTAQRAHHRLSQHDVVAPQRLVLGQVGTAPGVGELLREPGRERLVNIVDRHGP